MRDLEERLKELGNSASRHAPSELRPTARALRRIRVGRAVRSGAVLATVAALVIGGFAGARSLTRDEAVLPAEEDSNGNAFVDTWTTTDVDGRTRTMVIRQSGEHAYELTVQNHLALVCSGAPSTLTGTGRIFGSRLTIISPEITCDGGSEPKVPGFALTEVLTSLTFEHDPDSDTLTGYSPLERRRIGGKGQSMYSGFTLVWDRAGAENRVGDVNGWITYGDKGGIWARDLSSPGDPADRIHLNSTSGTLLGLSRDGSKLLVQRDVRDPGGRPHCPACGAGSILNETDLFVLLSDGTETRLTDPNEGVTGGGSFSPDGTAVVYAGYGAEGPAIYVVDAEGGLPQVILTPGSRRLPDEPDRFETELQEPKWSPDGSQIAYFEGMSDWGHSLRVMDSDGTDRRVIVENETTLGIGHVYGLQWSPDGSQLAFSLEGRLYVVGVDGSGFRLVSEDGVDPYWSPDGSHIAYTRAEWDSPEGGNLEIVRLDDLQAQNFGAGRSGPWTAELSWPATAP